MHTKLIFQGQEFILINDDGNRTEGAIATEEQFNNFEMSYTHLFENGNILRYGVVIGNISEIEWIDKPVKDNK